MQTVGVRKHRSERGIGVITFVLAAIGLIIIYAIGPMRANSINAAYGTDYLDEGSYEFVQIPAVIRSRKTGKMCLGIVTLDLQSSGEHWGTDFLTPYGVVTQGNPDAAKDLQVYIRDQYIPYDYWYTAEVENDIHIDLDNVPEPVADLIATARGEQPNMEFDYIKM